MYIYEVLEKADALYPNQYEDGEKIGWLDELGALLKSEYAKTYIMADVQYTDEGFVLPEGAEYEDIKRLYVNGVLFPILSAVCLPDRRMRRYIIDGAKHGDAVKIVYQERYVPITDTSADKTVCPAPYDAMYVDWLIAKYCFYDRDIEGYSQYMAMYNQRLLSWRNKLKEFAPYDKAARLTGWW